MPKTKQQKIDKVAELADKLSRAKSVVLADYQGLTMSQLADLRAQLVVTKAEFQVTKNNLLEIALKEAGLPNSDSEITGATATLFSFEDEISPIKVLVKSLKDFDKGDVKAGWLGVKPLSIEEIKRLSQLPSRDELRAKVVGTIGAPLYGLVNVMQGNLRNLVYVVNAIRERKSASVPM